MEEQFQIYKSILDLCPIPLLVINQEKIIVYANEAANTLFATPGTSVVFTPFKYPIQEHGILEIPQGKFPPLFFSLISSELPSHQQMIVLLDQNHAQSKIKELSEQKKESLSQQKFIILLDHEVRNKLHVVQEVLALFQEKTLKLNSEEGEQYIDIALRNAQSINTILSDASLISKIEHSHIMLNRKETDLNQLFHSLELLWSPKFLEKGMQLKIVYSDPPCRIFLDQTRFQQVLENLIRNALEHAGRGTVDISVSENGTEVLIVILDHGVGLSGKDLKNLFNKPDQLESSNFLAKKGQGLGLALCQNLINLHKGYISASSREGEGVELTIHLPRLSPTQLIAEKVQSLQQLYCGQDTPGHLILLESDGDLNVDSVCSELGKMYLCTVEHVPFDSNITAYFLYSFQKEPIFKSDILINFLRDSLPFEGDVKVAIIELGQNIDRNNPNDALQAALFNLERQKAA